MKERRLPYNFLLLNTFLWFVCTFSLSGQTVEIKDIRGLPLVGVEVFTEDLSFGEISDREGKVNIAGLDTSAILYFRFLGFREQIIAIGDLEKMGFGVVMESVDQLIDEVVILGRKEISQSEIPFQIRSISVEEIQSTQAQTSADALAQHGGVFVQKSQMGGGSPVIRGFEANRVLLVVDGIRLNNAIYRNGHLQNAITVDHAILEKMEVIFGPNSLIYGSDALGGVVNFQTKDPKFATNSEQQPSTANYYTTYATANSERSLHFDYSKGWKKLGVLTSLSYRVFGDLRSGNNRDERFPEFGKRNKIQVEDNNGNDLFIENEDPNKQVGTAYNQFDFLQKVVFRPNINHRIGANIQFSTSSDVPRYDNLNEIHNGQPRWAEWFYGPQRRFLGAVDYRHLASVSLYDQLILIASLQRIDEDRNSRRFGNQLLSTQEEDVNVLGFTLDAAKNLLNDKLKLEYGADIQHNLVSSTAFDTDIRTESIVPNQLTRYASDENEMTNVGGYLFLRGKINEQTTLSTGLRYAHSSYFLKYDRQDPVDWPEEFYQGIEGSNSALTWSIGGTLATENGFQLRSIISTAFRSPNIDDLSKIRVNNVEITFPNLNLQPERSFNGELTLGFQNSLFENISLTGFYTRLNDAITRRPYTGPGGETQWLTQGDTLNIVANQNIDEGEVYGLSMNLSMSISEALSYTASFNYTEGREISPTGEKSPLAHIPPVYGQAGIQFSKSRWSTDFYLRFNGSKPLSEYGGSADNPELATPIGTLAWTTANIYSKFELSPLISLSLAVENILDKHYRTFASGVSAPGRNIILSVRGTL